MADILIAGLFGGVIGYLAAVALFRTLYPVKVESTEDNEAIEQRYRNAEGK